MGTSEEYTPVNEATKEFMQMAYGDTERIAANESRLGLLLQKFMLVAGYLPALAHCADHVDQMALVEDPDAVVAGVFWIKMPNMMFCSVECAQEFAAQMRVGMGRNGLCDVCNEEKDLGDSSQLVGVNNVIIISDVCEECVGTDPVLVAEYN